MRAIVCDKCKKAITVKTNEKAYTFRLSERRVEDGEIMNAYRVIDLCEQCKNDICELIDKNLIGVNRVEEGE